MQARGDGSIKEMVKIHPTDLLAEVSLGLQTREECVTQVNQSFHSKESPHGKKGKKLLPAI